MKHSIFTLLLIALTTTAYPQAPDSVTAVAGSEYSISGFGRFFLGDQWRDVWATPLRVPVLDLKSFAGGLTPEKRGGGMQTKTLHFKGKDGQKWKFRSVNKFPEATLPPDVQDTYVSDYIKDQISGSHPAAPLVLTPLMDSLGILNAPPSLWFMPDDPLLGEFRDDFKNLMGMMEVNPDDEEEAPFANAEKVVSTEKLIFRLMDKRDEKVDGAAFLTARLFDVWINDWDRHMGQWKWAKFTLNGSEIWRPIPKDRDRAFSKFDGFLPWASTLMIPQWKNFGDDYEPVEFATWSGRYLDKRFLSELTREEWDSVTGFVVSRLTDELIDTALSRLPEEYKAASVSQVRGNLISRRKKLTAFSGEYFRFINSVVDIFTSDKDDKVDITRTDSSTIVTVSGGVKKQNRVLYHKEFSGDIVEDIRLHLAGGDDKVVIRGEVDSGPLIRMDGGKGDDSLIDSSKVRGWFLNILPVPRAENKNRFYDDSPNTSIIPGPGTKFFRQDWPLPKDTLEMLEPAMLEHGRGYGVYPVIDIGSTLGLQLGGGPVITNYDFRKRPWDSWMAFYASYATWTKDYDLDFVGHFKSIIEGTTVTFKAYRKAVDFNNYYGFGNHTTFDYDLYMNGNYRIMRRAIGGEVGINIPWSHGYSNYFNLRLLDLDVGLPNSSLLNGFPEGGYGTGRLSLLTLSAGIIFDDRDHVELPLSGWFMKAGGSITPKVFNARDMFWSANFDIRGYLPLGFVKNSAFAVRFMGEKVGGVYPFHMAAFLGGSKSLRGYRGERFSGDASLYGTAEVRVELGSIKTVIWSKLGVFFFTEVGRVFRNGEVSTLWHTANGIGAYLSFLDRAIVVSGTAGISREQLNLFVDTAVNF